MYKIIPYVHADSVGVPMQIKHTNRTRTIANAAISAILSWLMVFNGLPMQAIADEIMDDGREAAVEVLDEEAAPEGEGEEPGEEAAPEPEPEPEPESEPEVEAEADDMPAADASFIAAESSAISVE